jgi:hypothetical protein
MSDEPNTTDNYCDWRQSDCGLVAELRAELAAAREIGKKWYADIQRLESELAAERERADKAERREGNLRDHIVHLGQRLATLREALVMIHEYDGGTSPWKNWVAAIQDIAQQAAIAAVQKETKGSGHG